MSFFEQIVISIIFILFPFFVYFIFMSYKNNFTKRQDNLLLDVACFSSMFLLIRYKLVVNDSIYLMLLINIPLTISFIYERKFISIIISLAIIIYYNFYLDINVYFLFGEYIFYYIIYIYGKLDIEMLDYIFIFIKGVILSILVFYIFPDESIIVSVFKTLITLIIFYLINYFTIIVVKKADDIMNLNGVLSDLEKEKELKNSLFKMTHEVKNPISVCLGYLQMMDYSDISKVKRYNGIIKDEIDMTLNIMNDFNSYSKINVCLEKIDLITLVDDVICATENLLKNKNISIVNDISYNSLFVSGDYNRLKQVFVNVIKNSVESISDSGAINISLKLSKNKVMVLIIDNGSGMDKDTLKKIGEMFYTTKDNGTGLGVAMSKEIMKRHGGFLKYKSVLGKGTEALIALKKFS